MSLALTYTPERTTIPTLTMTTFETRDSVSTLFMVCYHKTSCWTKAMPYIWTIITVVRHSTIHFMQLIPWRVERCDSTEEEYHKPSRWNLRWARLSAGSTAACLHWNGEISEKSQCWAPCTMAQCRWAQRRRSSNQRVSSTITRTWWVEINIIFHTHTYVTSSSIAKLFNNIYLQIIVQHIYWSDYLGWCRLIGPTWEVLQQHSCNSEVVEKIIF